MYKRKLINLPKEKKFFIQSQKADPAPPLGTVLGNSGLNTVKFCNEFNLFTQELPIYFLLKVIVFILPGQNFRFETDLPSTSYLLNLLRYDIIIRTIIKAKKKVKIVKLSKKAKRRGKQIKQTTPADEDQINEKIISCIKLYRLIKLAKFKFPEISLKKAFSIILGTAKSCKLVITR